MSVIDAVKSTLATYGVDYVLRRADVTDGASPWKGTPAAPTYYACRAAERGYKPREIRGAIEAHDVMITVDASSLAVAPRKGDRIAVGVLPVTDDADLEWRTVVNSDPGAVGDIVAIYKLQARR